MRKIISILVLLAILREGDVLASSSSLMLKQAEEYFTLGKKYAYAGNLEQARTYYQKAVAINPNLSQAHLELAKIYQAMGWSEQTEVAYQQAGKTPAGLKKPKAMGTGSYVCADCAERETVGEARAWEKELAGKKEKDWLYVDKAKRGKILKNAPEIKEPDAIAASYQGSAKRDLYKAWRKGPSIASRLDPYHFLHEDFKIPYYKDREGLKLTQIVGVRGEYTVDHQLVGIESLIQEAQEFNQRTDEQARKYISLTDKEFHQEEIILHYKETWPKFTYTYLEERARREYDGKLLWSPNNVFYDNYDRRLYQIEHTIPEIKKLGALKVKFRYGDNTGFRPNDPASYTKFDTYLLGVETFPYLAFMDKTIGAKFEFMYVDGDVPRWHESGGSDWAWLERNYFVEFDVYYPEKFLRIKPHFYYEKERHYPSYNTWWLRKNGTRMEKDLNGRLRFVSDWTYINYSRDKDPYLSTANHITTSAWTWENTFEYELLRDIKLKLGFDYGKGLGFNEFDYYTLRTELQWKKPGLHDFRIGYGHTNYFELNDAEDTFLFKVGLFI